MSQSGRGSVLECGSRLPLCGAAGLCEGGRGLPPSKTWRHCAGSWLVVGALLLLALAACRTVGPLPPVDLSETGWTARSGQAVWRPQRGAPELAGELLVAEHADGRTFVQFTKTPFPLVVAQTTTAGWQIHFAPNDRTLRAPGPPPPRFLWLHLASALLRGAAPPDGWTAGERRGTRWRFENRATGETLEGFLNP